MKRHYVIGDVHGHFETLLALIKKLPKNAQIIFVGDLIDRGPRSKEVVSLVRKKGYVCVRGNHEQMMIDYGTSFLKTYPNSTNPSFLHTWYNNGAKRTLLSYGLIRILKDGSMECVENDKALRVFEDDLEWMRSLPLYVELPHKINGRPVVVSHASCADVWHLHSDPQGYETFKDYALWHRVPPKKESEIYNIFGHTPQEFGVHIEEHFANVDTGCYMKVHGFNELSAFCIETQEVVSVTNRD